MPLETEGLVFSPELWSRRELELGGVPCELGAQFLLGLCSVFGPAPGAAGASMVVMVGVS